ncbi:hypothetical protein LHP98_12510 [Rhodobacter sp. Har01]|uniref:hypothetical protein n=1 Tax=Rhodobacter sp. Har01 TaxID=2883999 RepID=UPI001D0862EF|nr:hypothetical protein [Rhodobacter sp. Har01]MCB6178947.1 hypothetical protein [Rhodobacter sp. Har01]
MNSTGLIFAAALIATAAPALAQNYEAEVLERNKAWVVEMVAWNDGTMGCVGTVSAPGESFSIWTFQDSSVQIQFYSTQWDFGDTGDTADLQVQIDRRSPWNLTGANLRMNSVLFTLPDSDAGIDFLLEVAKGNRLYLRSADGGDVQNYSLAGSKASIQSLIDCGDVITQQSAGNPFQ